MQRYEEQKYDHLLMQPSSALLGLVKERKYENVRNFMNMATSNIRVLHKHLATKTRRLDQSIAENQRLCEQNKDLVRRRTDMSRVDSLSHELNEVKRDKTKLTDYIQETETKLQISKSITFAGEKLIGTLKLEVEVLKTKMVRLEEENNRLQTECIHHAELKIDNARLQTEHVFLQCKNEELQEKCLFLESTSSLRAEQQMGHLKSENLVLKMEYETLKTENLTLKTETDLLKNQNESLKLQKGVAEWDLIGSKKLVSQQREDLRSLQMQVKAFEEANQARSEQMFQEGVSLETVLSNNNLKSILCPITMDLMTDPVMAEDNYTYSKTVLERHIRMTGTPSKSPMTNAAMGTSYKSNWAMKGLIEELKEIMPRVGTKTNESV
jgi:chromosome segregation ATPase